MYVYPEDTSYDTLVLVVIFHSPLPWYWCLVLSEQLLMVVPAPRTLRYGVDNVVSKFTVPHKIL